MCLRVCECVSSFACVCIHAERSAHLHRVCKNVRLFVYERWSAYAEIVGVQLGMMH